MTASDLSDVFISYRRTNVDFAKQLVKALNEAGKEVWVDWEDIPPGSEAFTDDIKRGLEGADAFICVLTPDYLESTYCVDMELGYALELKKKIIPVVLEKFEGHNIPSSVGHINWIYFVPHAGADNNFEQSFPRIMDALDQDFEHAREHRRLALRALDWDNNDRKESFLLVGDEIHRAEEWMIDGIDKIPEPTVLHRNYIRTSRTIANQQRRQRRLVTGALIIISTLTVIAIGMGILANVQRQEAETQAIIAATSAQDANNSAGTAVAALDEAELQAQIAATQAAIAEIAQDEAVVQAEEAATQAEIARENAITATIAQGQAQQAATGEAIAQMTAAYAQEFDAQLTQGAIAAAAATKVRDALATSESNALTATVAQGQALIQADNAATQAEIAEIAQGEAVIQAEEAATQAAIAEENAIVAQTAQGEALIEADRAETQAAIAEENAIVATIAQGEALIEADRAETQAAIAKENAIVAQTAQGEALIEAATAAAAEQLAEQRRMEAQAQALTVRAEQARLFGDANVALALALQAAELNPNLLQTQSVLNQAASVSPRLSIANIRTALIRPNSNHLLVQNDLDPTQLTLWDINTQQVIYIIQVETPVEDYTFSLNGEYLIGALGGDGVAIWDAETGSVVKLLQDQISNRVLAHPDNLRFISAGMDGVIFIRDLTTGEVLGQLTNTTTTPYDQITFNVDGRWLYAWSIEPPTVMTLWNIENPEPTKRSIETYLYVTNDGAFRVNRVDGQFVIHNMDGDGIVSQFDGDIVEIYAFTTDNTQVLVKGQGGRFGADTKLALLNRSNGDINVIYPTSPELELTIQVQEARFLPDGQSVVTIQDNNDVLISNGFNGDFIRRIGISSSPLSLGVNNETYTITFTENHTVLVFDINGLDTSGIEDPSEKVVAVEQIKASYFDDGGLYGELYDLDWQITSLSGFFELRTFDGFDLELINTARGEQIGLIPNKIDGVDSSERLFSPNFQYVVLGWREGNLRIWDIQAGEVLWEYLEGEENTNLEEIKFIRGNQFVAFYGQKATLWDIESGEPIRDYLLPDHVSTLTRNSIINNGSIHSWMFVERHNQILRNDEVVARILFDETTLNLTLALWDLETGEVIRQQNLRAGIGGEGRIGTRFTADGQNYVRIGQDGNIVEMYNSLTGIQIRRFIGHRSHPVGVGFSPSGEQLVTASEDGEIILWDVQTGQLVRTLVIGNPLNALANSLNIVFSPDGTYVGYTRDDTPIPSSNLEVVKVETLTDVVNWVRRNRNIRELSCAEREQYSVLPLCDGGVETPTPTPTTISQLVISPTATPEPTLTPTPTDFPRGVVQADSNVNLRSGPGADYRIIASVPPDTIVIILDDQPITGWIQVESLDGNQGWILEAVVAR